jgi:transposase/DNA-binding XRE family transcriptional regulator
MSAKKLIRISIRQMKAARELIGWKQTDLADACGLSIVTIRRLESREGRLGGRADAAARIIAALESAGVIFIDENGEGLGLRPRKTATDAAAATNPLEQLNAENDARRATPGMALVRKSLTNEQWDRIKKKLPGKTGDPGCRARDNRLFIEAVLWIARTGSPWRDLPDKFGKWYTAYTRCRRWSETGVWRDVFEALSDDPNFEFVLIDETIRARDAKTRPKRALA